MTRLETFADAAFAFSAALLTISIDEVPSNYDELIVAMQGAASENTSNHPEIDGPSNASTRQKPLTPPLHR